MLGLRRLVRPSSDHRIVDFELHMCLDIIGCLGDFKLRAVGEQKLREMARGKPGRSDVP